MGNVNEFKSYCERLRLLLSRAWLELCYLQGRFVTLIARTAFPVIGSTSASFQFSSGSASIFSAVMGQCADEKVEVWRTGDVSDFRGVVRRILLEP